VLQQIADDIVKVINEEHPKATVTKKKAD